MLIRFALSESLSRIDGDLCRATDGRFSACSIGAEVVVEPPQSTAPPSEVHDPELVARAEKLKTPLEMDVRIKMLKMGASKYPSPSVNPKTIVFRPDRVNSGAIMEWIDSKGNSQRAYSTAFLERNAEKKWHRVSTFRSKLLSVRSKLRDDISSSEPGSPGHQAAVIAAIIAETGLRPGGRDDSVKAGHYGISDLRPEHVEFSDDGAVLSFVGKAGKMNRTEVRDPVTVAALRFLKSNSDGELFSIGPEKARATLPAGMKLKDLRTIIATEEAERALSSIKAPPPPLPEDPESAKKLIAKLYMQASTVVAKKLNNTPAIARAAYIHPEVLNAWVYKIGGGSLIRG